MPTELLYGLIFFHNLRDVEGSSMHVACYFFFPVPNPFLTKTILLSEKKVDIDI